MTVRTDDIALSHLSEDSRRPRVADHPSDEVSLRRRIPVIELHDVGCVSLATVVAWHIAQSIQQFSLRPRPLAHVLDASRFAAARPSPVVFAPLSPRSHGVTVRAHDIAFRNFSGQHVAVLEQRLVGEQRERLYPRIAVIEVHHVRGKRPSAVGAGHSS
jgi:hypothetical protein